MPDILHTFPIEAPAEKVFAAMTAPPGLDQWWTKRSKGSARVGETYELWFGPEYDWRARVTECEPNRLFQLTMVSAMEDWKGTTVGFRLTEKTGHTSVEFWHVGWKEESDHFKTSSFCWAMYLRILKRWVEKGETVPYEKRLNV